MDGQVPPQVIPASIYSARQDSRTQELDQLTAEAIASPETFYAQPAKAARLLDLRNHLYPPQPPQPMELIREIEVSSDASAEEEEFLVLRAQAWNAMAAVHNQFLGLSESARAAALSKLSADRSVEATDARIQILAQVIADNNPAPVLPAIIDIPPTASPALRSFLAERNALIALMRENPALPFTDPARQARERTLQQKAQALAEENTPVNTR